MKGNEIIIDARGRSCPEPVLMTKKGIAANPSGVDVIVDNVTARENIKRFAKNSGYSTEVIEKDGEYTLKLRK